MQNNNRRNGSPRTLPRKNHTGECLLNPITCVTCDTRAGNLGQGRERWLDVARGGAILRGDRETASVAMHGRAGVLHTLWHEFRHLVRAMQFERTHAQTVFSNVRSFSVAFSCEGSLNFGQCEQMVAHVGERSDFYFIRKFHELTRVGRAPVAVCGAIAGRRRLRAGRESARNGKSGQRAE